MRRKYQRAALAFAGCLGAACSGPTTAPESELSISEGRKVAQEEPLAAVVAALVYTGKPEHEGPENGEGRQSPTESIEETFCTAVVVSRTQLLTAAHCTGVPDFAEHLSVVFSTNVDSAEAVERQVESVEAHQDYVPEDDTESGSPLNDLALITLKKKAPGRAYPISLFPEGPRVRKYVTPIRILGYGRTAKDDPKKGVLRATMTYMEAEPPGSAFTTNSLGERNACYGDSGGPAIVTQDGEPRLLGVSTYLFANEEEGCRTGRAAYTDVRKFRSWIAGRVEKLR